MESGSLTEPLWDASTVSYPYPNNGIFVREYTIKLLCGSFPNITAPEVNGVQFFFYCFFARGGNCDSFFKRYIERIKFCFVTNRSMSS